MKVATLPDGRSAKVLEFRTKQGRNVVFTVLLKYRGWRTLFEHRQVSIFQVANRLFVRWL
jgi:hypothetical protein